MSDNSVDQSLELKVFNVQYLCQCVLNHSVTFIVAVGLDSAVTCLQHGNMCVTHGIEFITKKYSTVIM